MKLLLRLWVFTLSLSCFAESVFLIPPYVVKSDFEEDLLRFKLNTDYQLRIVVDDGEGDPRSYTEQFQENILYTINLGKGNCDGEVSYLFKGGPQEDIIHSGFYNQIPCDSYQDLNFVFMGDTQWKEDRHEKLAKAMVKRLRGNEKFVVHAGDVVQTGGDHEHWVEFFQKGSAYLNRLPIVSAVGNHEYRDVGDDATPRNFQHYLRWQGSNYLGVNKYRFPQVDLIVLNSNFKDLNDYDGERVLHWLEHELEISKLSGKHVIVAAHHPPFASSLAKYGKSCKIMRKEVVPILERAGNVLLVIAGHTHVYERSYKDGINYVTTGPAGGKRFPAHFPNKYRVFLDRKFLETFSRVQISKNYIKLETYNRKDEKIDTFAKNFEDVDPPFRMGEFGSNSPILFKDY